MFPDSRDKETLAEELRLHWINLTSIILKFKKNLSREKFSYEKSRIQVLFHMFLSAY